MAQTPKENGYDLFIKREQLAKQIAADQQQNQLKQILFDQLNQQLTKLTGEIEKEDT